MANPHIVAIVGSLRQESYNRQLAKAAQVVLGERADFTLLDYADVPMMNQDIEFPAPAPVARVRELVQAADGLWFFTPEYNHYFPGVLKNLIDWLSRPLAPGGPYILSKKKAAISGVSPGMSGTCIAQDHLVGLLSFLNLRIMNLPRLIIPNAEQQLNAEGKLELTASARYLEKQADAFLRFLAD